MFKFPCSLTNVASKAQYCWTKAPIWSAQKLQTVHIERKFLHEGLKSSNLVWQRSTSVNFPLICRNKSSSSDKNTRKSSRKLVLFGVGTAVVVSLGLTYSDYKKSKQQVPIDCDSTAPANKEFTKIITKKVKIVKRTFLKFLNTIYSRL